MTARMHNSFNDYFDFIDILKEALETAPRRLFESMVYLIINKFHNKEIELQKLALEIDEMSSIPIDNLEEFYDDILESIEDIKLFKKKLQEIKSKDYLLESLYNQADKLHTALLIYMDRMGQLEVRVNHQQK